MGDCGSLNTIAVIPARGGSKGIPRKNARILAGKPLIAYTIEASRAASCFSEIYVSTDDPEIEEISLRFGAKVIRRPVGLANDVATLDEVIVDAFHQLRLKEGRNQFHYLATIQPTSPLLSAQTISQAVAKCNKGVCDTVLTATNEPHLAWTICEKRPVPLYIERANRQLLPPYLRETGGVVVCPVEQLEHGSRFGDRIEIVEVSKQEAIDVDDYFDWWLAEKALNRKKILFHIIGDHTNGLGHVYRALTIAYRMPSHHASFLVSENSQLAAQILKRNHQEVTLVTPGKELEFILNKNPDLLINDVLDTSKEFMEAVQSAGIVSINFEDQGIGSRFASVLINAMYNDEYSRNTYNLYQGVEYCCLRDEFYSIVTPHPNNEVQNILLLFGGTDPSGLTYRCLKWVDQLEGQWSVTVIIGPGNKDVKQLDQLVKSCDHQVSLIYDTSIISKYMAKADIAVTSAGRTVFELAALGKPMIVIAQNKNEQRHVFATTAPGIIYIGAAETLSKTVFCQSIKELIDSRLLRSKMIQSLLNSDIRGGVHRVIGLIEKAISGMPF